MKSFLKSKTMWLGFATGIVGLITATMQDAPLDPQISGMVLGALGAISMFLRSITTTAIGSE